MISFLFLFSSFNCDIYNNILGVGPIQYIGCRRYSTYMNYYRKTSNISRTLVGNKIVDNSDVVGALPFGAAPTTSSFST